MNISPEHTQLLTQWVNEGLSLSQIQQKLEKECNLSITYMNLRFLIDDLNLSLISKEAPLAQQPETKKEALPDSNSPSVIVNVDPITRPGTVASGSVTFSDHSTCSWQLDRMGRLGLVPPHEGYSPPAEDIPLFQAELQKQLQKIGL